MLNFINSVTADFFSYFQNQLKYIKTDFFFFFTNYSLFLINFDKEMKFIFRRKVNF